MKAGVFGIFGKAVAAVLALVLLGTAADTGVLPELSVRASAANAEVSIDPETGTLTLGAGTVSKDEVRKYRKKAKSIVAADGAVLPASCYNLFGDFGGVTDIDLSKADTSKVTDMRAMFIRCTSLVNLDMTGADTSSLIGAESLFEDCTSLKTLDLTFMDTSKIEYWSCMFKGCSALTTVYVSDKWTGVRDTYVTAWLTENLFDGCVNIRGGNGTTYDAKATDDMKYARADRNGEPGYLTYKPAGESGAVASVFLGANTVKLSWEPVIGAACYDISTVDSDDDVYYEGSVSGNE
ncbi:MAG: BspA family leucine-rich repeat surface protein, partial [Ruminiclostridium sp.]|nr:BspA family leucine-rich repeat surface protein [Ruminiclostridium sp.]